LGLRFAPGGMRANVAARSEQPNWHDAGLLPSDRHLPKQRSKLNPLASRCCAVATVPPSSTNAAVKPARIAFIRTFCRSMAQPHNEIMSSAHPSKASFNPRTREIRHRVMRASDATTSAGRPLARSYRPRRRAQRPPG
jgi:hypothetical protein